MNPAFLLLRLIDFYSLLIFVWVLGSWFPQWRHQEWYRVIGSVCEPYINLFRGLNLQFGGLDLTPMAAMLMLQLFEHMLAAAMFRGLR